MLNPLAELYRCDAGHEKLSRSKLARELPCDRPLPDESKCGLPSRLIVRPERPSVRRPPSAALG